MRFGKWRGGLALAAALVVAFAAGEVRADGWHTIPRLSPAIDVNTGGEYYAPPIPYGHYAKDCGAGLSKCLGLLCGFCGKFGCGLCGGNGLGCGLGHGSGGDPCHACGGKGCGFCKGLGLFHRNNFDPGCGGDPGCGAGTGCGGFGHGRKLHACGLGGGGGCVGKASTVMTSTQIPTPQVPIASGQCGVVGCPVKTKHFHRRGRPCNLCGGRGCGGCGFGGMIGDPCGSCGGRGCGLCGQKGMMGDPCSSCGGRGCGLCHGLGRGCGACGGRGCKLCLDPGLLMGLPHTLLAKLFHHGSGVKWFVGPGGPVPLTPGYVPYVNVTRSPRDFLAFPPFVDTDP